MKIYVFSFLQFHGNFRYKKMFKLLRPMYKQIFMKKMLITYIFNFKKSE